MKSKFVITLFNSQTEQFASKEEDFLTFEEAVVYANTQRNKMGHQWSTTSIVKVLKGSR